MIVVDASVLAPALADDGAAGVRARERLRGMRLAAPFILDLEVIAALRHVAAAEGGDERAAGLAARRLAGLRIRRLPHVPLLPRIWALRHDVTAYDAAYVAVAEAMGAPLVTADARLAGAPGIRCEVELLR